MKDQAMSVLSLRNDIINVTSENNKRGAFMKSSLKR